MEPVHGHDWQVRLTIGTEHLDEIETVMDFHVLESLLATTVKPLAGHLINEIQPFVNGMNPSAERIAEYLADKLSDHLPRQFTLIQVQIMEAPGCWATYTRSS